MGSPGQTRSASTLGGMGAGAALGLALAPATGGASLLLPLAMGAGMGGAAGGQLGGLIAPGGEQGPPGATPRSYGQMGAMPPPMQNQLPPMLQGLGNVPQRPWV
jgi:hypothetical protein